MDHHEEGRMLCLPLRSIEMVAIGNISHGFIVARNVFCLNLVQDGRASGWMMS